MNQRIRDWLVALSIVAVVAVASAVFVVDADATPEPASFDETVPVGLTLESEQDLDPEVSLPRAQVFYSQYEYVVGYYGVETFVEERRDDGHERRFGFPLAVYVTDYGDGELSLSEEGFPTPGATPGWTDATTASFVVGSDARTPGGETVLSFADREAAERFAETHGGAVYTWEAVLEATFDRDDAGAVRERVDERHAVADERVATAAAHDDRPVSLEVGADPETVQEAVDAAPANTTVVVPEGVHEETVEIDRPITLAGEGTATIRGDGNGSVVTITEPDVGIRNLSIDGVGSLGTGAESVPGEIDDGWDEHFQTTYAGADAGISAHEADGVSVEGVAIETPSNGVILRASPGGVVRDVTIQGNVDWEAGFASVMAFHTPGVIEDVTVLDGRDGIYSFRSPGIVVRNNVIEGSLLGVHLMHTDEALVADNQILDPQNTGIYVMTGPERNAFVGNHVTGTELGVFVGGADSYVAENVLADNDVGLQMEATSTIYEHNALVDNGVGARERALLPTNRVVANDFVGNDRHATVNAGPLRVYTHDDTGNFWEGATNLADGDPPTRAYTPTDAVDGRMHTTDGAVTLARAPAVDALAGLEESVAGMQTGAITDLSPACEPMNPVLLDRLDRTEAIQTCTGTDERPDHPDP